LQQRPDIQVVPVKTHRVIGYPFNMKRAPTSDVRVRQAINYAVDKETIIEKFLLGGGRPAVAPIGPGLPGWTKAGYYKYDPDKARSLIREAGAEGASIRIRAVKGRYVMGSEIAEAIAEMLKKVGLQPILEIAGDWPAYVAAMEKREHHMALLGWAPASFVTDAALTPLYLCNQKFFNWGDYCNPQVDALVLKARGTIDSSGQNALYAEIQKKLMDDAAWLYLYYEDVHLAFKKGVKGYYISPDSGVYLWNASVE
jgi:peptide/nickel transport system substrate-binding protein